MREHYTQIYTRARARANTIICIYMNSCKYVHTHAYTHTRCIRHKRVGQAKQVSQCRPPLSNERELWKRASERRWRRKLKTVLCTRHHRPFGEESMRPFVTRQNFPSPHSPSIPLPSCPFIFLENTQGQQDRATCTMWKRARWTARGLRTNFHSDSVNPIYIVDRPSGNNRRDNKAPSQIPTRPNRQWWIVVYRKKRRKNDRELCDVIPADMVLTLIKTHFYLADDSRQLVVVCG